MTRTQIYLPEETLIEAKLNAQIQNVNLSQYIRDAIKHYSKTSRTKTKTKHDKKLKLLTENIQRGVGDPESAINHNDIYNIKA